MPATPAAPRWPVDLDGDPDEVVGSTEAARVIGHPSPNHLPHSLLELADELEYHPDGTVRRRGWRRETLWRYVRVVMAERTTEIDGGLALDRAGIADRLGIHLSRVDAAIAGSPDNGFPEPVNGHWRLARDVDAWYEQHRQQQLDSLTTVDYTGDPDDLLTKAEAARVIGYSDTKNLDNSSVWRALLARHNPDHDDTIARSGRPRRRFPRRVVWEIAEARTGRTGRPRGATRTPDRTGDPDELVGATEAARVLDYKAPAGLPKPLLAQADQPGPPRRWKRRTLWDFHDSTTNAG